MPSSSNQTPSSGFPLWSLLPKGQRLPLVLYILVIFSPISFFYWSWQRYFQSADFTHSGTTLSVTVGSGFIVIVVTVVLLLAYRAVAEGRFEALAILVNLTALTQGISLLVVILPAPDEAFHLVDPTRAGEIRLVFVTLLVVLFVLGLAHLLLATIRRSLTENRIDQVLEAISRKGFQVPNVYSQLGKALLQEDFFPSVFPQNILNIKERNRELFVQVMRERVGFNENMVSGEDFLVTTPSKGSKDSQISNSVPRDVDGSWYFAFSLTSGVFVMYTVLWMSFIASQLFLASVV